jgi:hypothetical protein
MRAIDLAHAASAHLRHNPIWTELPARKRNGARIRYKPVKRRGCFHETPGFLTFGQQQFNLLPQIDVATACVVKERRSLFGLLLQSRVEKHRHPLPTFVLHSNFILAVS